jgi:pyrimidine deaminase RibD-like protein
MDDHDWLRLACELALLCPPSDTAFAVGAVVVSAEGDEIARGHSREADPHDHAEEAALGKIDPHDPRLPAATLYSSLEPCSTRGSRPLSCTHLILDRGIGRVVFAWREPLLFVDGHGTEELRAAGVAVREIPDLAAEARRPNAHLLS